MSTTASFNNTVTFGEPANLDTTSVEIPQMDFIENRVQHRLNDWEAAIESELQALITEASTVRAEISSAKTQTKKKYFQKKFEKVNIRVRQMLIALQRVKAQQTAAMPSEQAANVSSTDPI